MFENLSKEVLEKIKQAKSKEEALNILKENGITLTDEDLAGVAGGDGESCTTQICPDNCMFYDPSCILIHRCPEDCFQYTGCTQFCFLDGVCLELIG